MNLLESIRVSWGALTANRMRSILTMLGVIIGVGAVVTLVTLGQGVQGKIMDTLGSMGSNSIRVDTFMGYARMTAEDGQMVKDKVESLTHYTPWVVAPAVIKRGTTSVDTELHGTARDALDIYSFEVGEGRFFSERETQTRQNVCVLGTTVKNKLFGSRSALGETISVRGEMFTVIGVLKSKGAYMGEDMDNLVFVPYTTAQRMLGTRYVQMLLFKVRSAEDAPAAKTHITRILEVKFRNEQRPKDDIMRRKAFNVMSMDEMLTAINTVTATFTVFLAGIAAISLLVGGVGIMNIMLVSVTERTKEIGIRKAIGAGRGSIMMQFLIEALAISLLGCMFGLALSWGILEAITLFADMSFGMSADIIALAVGFSCAIGLTFGLYPANKAAKKHPIEALRYQG